MIAYGYRKKQIEDSWEKFECNANFPNAFSVIQTFLEKLGYDYFIFTIKEIKNGCL